MAGEWQPRPRHRQAQGPRRQRFSQAPQRADEGHSTAHRDHSPRNLSPQNLSPWNHSPQNHSPQNHSPWRDHSPLGPLPWSKEPHMIRPLPYWHRLSLIHWDAHTPWDARPHCRWALPSTLSPTQRPLLSTSCWPEARASDTPRPPAPCLSRPHLLPWGFLAGWSTRGVWGFSTQLCLANIPLGTHLAPGGLGHWEHGGQFTLSSRLDGPNPDTNAGTLPPPASTVTQDAPRHPDPAS
ncbi:uncharacterized protein LOC144339592 isoform X2 [Macaca mulatta]